MTKEPALPLPEKRRRPIPLMTWVFLGTGVMLGFMFAMLAQQNKNATGQFAISAAVSVAVCALLAIPIKDRGVPHQAIAYKIREYRVARRSDISPPLARQLAGKPVAPSAFDNAKLIEARYYGSDGTVKSMPALKDGDYLILVIRTGGMPLDIATSSGELRYTRQSALNRAIQAALESTPLSNIMVVQGMIHRPEDPMLAVAHMQRRVEPGIIAAVKGSSQKDGPRTAQEILGEKMLERIASVEGSGGHNENYILVRLPWPTRIGRKIDVRDPNRFLASDAYSILDKLLVALRQHRVSPELLDWQTAHEWWDGATNSPNLSNIQGAAYDRYKTGTEYTNLVPLRMPSHTRAAKSEENNACLAINGGFVAAGYGKDHTIDHLPTGFENLVVLPADADYNIATVMALRPIGGRFGQRTKGREQERWQGVWHDIEKVVTGSEHLSQPDAEFAEQQTKEWRRSLVNAGLFTADYWPLLIVWGSSPEDVDRRWRTVTNGLRSILTFEREPNVEDIEELYALSLGIVRQ